MLRTATVDTGGLVDDHPDSWAIDPVGIQPNRLLNSSTREPVLAIALQHPTRAINRPTQDHQIW
jgi:hypothetical protein